MAICSTKWSWSAARVSVLFACGVPEYGLGYKSVAADWYCKVHRNQSPGSWDRLRALVLFYTLKTK